MVWRVGGFCDVERAIFRFYFIVWAFCPGLGAILGEKWPFLAQNCADLGGRHRWVFGSKLGFGKATT